MYEKSTYLELLSQMERTIKRRYDGKDFLRWSHEFILEDIGNALCRRDKFDPSC